MTTDKAGAMVRLYADRDVLAIAGLYARHVNAMTTEGLHAKSDIAAELAWRDAEIERLRATLSTPTSVRGLEPVVEIESAIWRLGLRGVVFLDHNRVSFPEREILSLWDRLEAMERKMNEVADDIYEGNVDPSTVTSHIRDWAIDILAVEPEG